MNPSGAFSGIVARAAYPGVLTTSMALAILLLDRGVALGLTTSAVFIATLLLRWWHPRRLEHQLAWPWRGSRTATCGESPGPATTGGEQSLVEHHRS